MINELKQELFEQEELIKKARKHDFYKPLLYNSICFMYEQNLTEEDIADYLGLETDELETLKEELGLW